MNLCNRRRPRAEPPPPNIPWVFARPDRLYQPMHKNVPLLIRIINHFLPSCKAIFNDWSDHSGLGYFFCTVVHLFYLSIYCVICVWKHLSFRSSNYNCRRYWFYIVYARSKSHVVWPRDRMGDTLDVKPISISLTRQLSGICQTKVEHQIIFLSLNFIKVSHFLIFILLTGYWGFQLLINYVNSLVSNYVMSKKKKDDNIFMSL